MPEDDIAEVVLSINERLDANQTVGKPTTAQAAEWRSNVREANVQWDVFLADCGFSVAGPAPVY